MPGSINHSRPLFSLGCQKNGLQVPKPMSSQQTRSRHRTHVGDDERSIARGVIVHGGRKTYAALTLLIAALLVYLELYPFSFRVPLDDIGAWQKLIESWAERSSRGD